MSNSKALQQKKKNKHQTIRASWVRNGLDAAKQTTLSNRRQQKVRSVCNMQLIYQS